VAQQETRGGGVASGTSQEVGVFVSGDACTRELIKGRWY